MKACARFAFSPPLKHFIKTCHYLFQVEINPLGEREDGTLVNMDAKFSFDNNAVYRQPRVAALAAQSRKLEVEAAGEHSLLALETTAEAQGLNYIGLPDGNIGCMVNGAGLAMATLDLLSLHKGRAANFLDLGGKASQSDVEYALRTLSRKLLCLVFLLTFSQVVRIKGLFLDDSDNFFRK